jgi:hypothetical protein
MAERAVDNLLATLAGEPMPYRVNPEVYARAEKKSATALQRAGWFCAMLSIAFAHRRIGGGARGQGLAGVP